MFKKDIRNFINKIDSNIEVEFEQDMQEYGLACEPTEEKIYIGFRTTQVEEQTFIDYVNQLEKDFFNKYNVNCFILSLLHEVGHIMTHNEELEEEYNKDTELLNYLEENELITKTDQCRLYVQLELERLATQWAIDFIKDNQLFIIENQENIVKRLTA